MRTISFSIFLLLFSSGPLLMHDSFAEENPPLEARIVLKNDQTWSVQLLGRFFADRILLRKENEQGTFEIPIADIGRMDVKIGVQAGELLDQYQAGDLDGAAQGLQKVIAPYRDYITDAPGNLAPLVQALLKSHYQLGSHAEAIKLADQILSKTASSRLRTDATCIKTLSLLANGQKEEAVKAAAELTALADAQAQDALVLYTHASLKMQRGQISEAQETLARLITFHSHNFEWMPPALILSAEGYARTGHPEVAEQIIEEIKLNFPGTRWVAVADALDVKGLRPEEESMD